MSVLPCWDSNKLWEGSGFGCSCTQSVQTLCEPLWAGAEALWDSGPDSDRGSNTVLQKLRSDGLTLPDMKMHIAMMFNSDRWNLSLCLYLHKDTFDIRILMAKSVKYTVNFLESKEEDLYKYVSTSAPKISKFSPMFYYSTGNFVHICR